MKKSYLTLRKDSIDDGTSDIDGFIDLSNRRFRKDIPHINYRDLKADGRDALQEIMDYIYDNSL